MTEQTDRFQHWLDHSFDVLLAYLPKVALALLVLWLGMRMIKLISRALARGLERREVDPTLRRFIRSLVDIGLRVLLFVTAIQMMGVATTSFVAIIGAAGLAIGLALQGTLANFAGGVLVLLFKPYSVGDLIEAQGNVGHVKDIQIFTTLLLTLEHKTVIVPNGAMANGIITNYSSEGRIRVDCVLAIDLHADIKHARRVLEQVMRADSNVLQDPRPSVTMSKQLPDSVELAVRPWCDPKNYWDVYFATLERGKEALEEAGIKFPMAEHKVHLYNS